MQGHKIQLHLMRHATAFAAACALLFTSLAGAQAFESHAAARTKISDDLNQAISANSVAGIKWAKETYSGRMVKVLVMARPTVDPDLQSLRSAIVSAGGSVYYRYISVNGVAAVVPASRLSDIARRSDVESISPNRMTARTGSLLEKATGAAGVRGAGTASNPTIDGSGVGIAFLDSGIMATHKAFAGSSGSRVKKSVDFGRADPLQLLGSYEWRGGYDHSKSFYPGSSFQRQLEAIVNTLGGHGPSGRRRQRHHRHRARRLAL